MRLAAGLGGLLIALGAVACGGVVGSGEGDASVRDAAAPFPFDGSVACGAMECGPGTVCVTTVSGAGPGMLLDDAGGCPDGETNMLYMACYPVTYECRSTPATCTPSPAGPCACNEICAPPSARCTCPWPPTSQQLLCNCTQT